ncbi:hypothetical protein [Rathayibacter sp. VKM Ac-2857]|uniref:hypothetical protein n=1 Tax=Rathayibacter sp. VKM Ac-2857 TaxID=2739020 RepID=UPI0015655FF2|nr:hypothetical protein [Rathayibacter sp. VKM Ac-2857]NQX16902.1 hypothetical protein [Rathayibacter sp. VKM Ac-2857]
MSHTLTPTRPEDVVLDPVGAEGWRVRNGAEPVDNPLAFLGFVTAVDDGYDVHRIGRPGEDLRRATLDAVREAYLERGPGH